MLSAGCDGRQWDFVKIAPEDLRTLYGIGVAEMNVWRPVLEHVVEGLEDGIHVTVEVDGFWLPDTAGTSYRNQHTKTTIVPNLVDRDGKVMGYFHNRGYFELTGAISTGSSISHRNRTPKCCCRTSSRSEWTPRFSTPVSTAVTSMSLAHT